MIGQSPSIIRAIVCSLISYLAIFIQKRSDSINNLSIVGIFLIINNPYVIYNISFQLSFLATLSIIYFYGYINKKIKFKIVSLTLAANILTIPIVYLYFKNISMVFVVSNIVVVPLLSIIIYISIFSAILLPFSLILTKIMVEINTGIIDFVYSTLEFLYNINGSYIEFEKVYDDIVSYTLELAKNEFPKWYEAFLNGEKIKKERLISLNKLHKPTT